MGRISIKEPDYRVEAQLVLRGLRKIALVGQYLIYAAVFVILLREKLFLSLGLLLASVALKGFVRMLEKEMGEK